MKLACSVGFEITGTHEWYTYDILAIDNKNVIGDSEECMVLTR